MLTIFATPKPFNSTTEIIQRNAIVSWQNVIPSCEIILLGDDQGVGEFANEHGLRHLPDIECNHYGTPLISSIFERATSAAKYNRLVYINADIILPRNFLSAIDSISLANYLLIGRRTGVDVSESIDFTDPDWDGKLLNWAHQHGYLESSWAMDYFIFPRGLWDAIPQFAIGRFGWDNWLVYDVLRRRVPVVDMTHAVTVLHQDHEYQATAGFDPENWNSEEIKNNLRLAGKGADFGVRQSDWRLKQLDDGSHQSAYRIVPNPERMLASLETNFRRWRRRLGNFRRLMLGPFRKAA